MADSPEVPFFEHLEQWRDFALRLKTAKRQRKYVDNNTPILIPFALKGFFALFPPNQRRFRTSDGRPGFANEPALPEHDILIMKGFRFPVIAEKVEHGYKLVAIAYVDGMMRGEKWPEDESTLESFTIV